MSQDVRHAESLHSVVALTFSALSRRVCKVKEKWMEVEDGDGWDVRGEEMKEPICGKNLNEMGGFFF